MLTTVRFCGGVALALAFIVLGRARADERAGDKGAPVEKENLTALRQTTWELIRELEDLQEELTAENAGGKERALYRQADATLAAALKLQLALENSPTREALYKQYDEIDRPLEELQKTLQELSPEARSLRRSANRISAADERLHYALSAGDRSEARSKLVLRRQARALVLATRDLDQVGRFTLANTQGGDVLAADLKKLAAAAEQFRMSLDLSAEPAQVQKNFEPVNQVWERVVGAMQKLPPAENVYFLRSAGRVDHIHEHLHQLLHFKEKRPGLTLRA